MAELTTPVSAIYGINTRNTKALSRLGIETLRDLIGWFPRRYDDRTQIKHIADLSPDETACVSAVIAAPPVLSYVPRSKMYLVKMQAIDECGIGILDIIFFNQPWQKDQFFVGKTYIFYGRAEGDGLQRKFMNPVAEESGRQNLTGRIVPIYPLTAGIKQQTMARCIRNGLDACLDILPEVLTDKIRREHQLCRIRYAYENIHFPASQEALEIARRRLAFEELFLFTGGMLQIRKRREIVHVPPCQEVDMSVFYQALPFDLTDAQHRCIDEALADMRSGVPMNRLCQGDVGSGKTMTAAACVYFMVKNNRQAALMAPTEILARQHYTGLAPILENLGIRCALLTGSTSAKEKRIISAQLATGEIDFMIGTHALITSGLNYAALGLVVTDEQHRFGVAQRAALVEKGEHPHTLVMSATPIPRTLALILYGDLDISIIDQLPPGRRPVATYAVSSGYHTRVYQFIRKLIEKGRQAYIVCSMVEETGAGDSQSQNDRKAVLEYANMLQTKIFPDLKVAFVHGKMKAREKEEVMRAFAAHETDILVSTTVIEVGVDVPNAAVIVVENAERFGLSQLHQLRGRVGRGSHQSYCVLISDNRSEETRQRLRVMTKTTDGFKIAEEDLKLRGPGDFFGQRQHGIPGLKIADLGCDAHLLKEARSAVASLLDTDPNLETCPAVAERIAELFREASETMN